MGSLRRDLRRQLEAVITQARMEAERGARMAIESLAVHSAKTWPTMNEEQRQLRNRLRVHGRQLGDRRDEKTGGQQIEHLVQECAYEQWHRMLFARFLAECDLLIEPESGVAITLDECRELALERGVDWLSLASEFAVKMLPQIFRAGDPVLEVSLPPETRQKLDERMKSLPRDVFLADDSLGWVYQFWQAKKKQEVNDSGNKIGADELAPVTQLFTEDYMVLFLLHNTLGAWWAGKVLAQRPQLATSASSEDELREACSVGDVQWEYLRFVREGGRPWRPATGTFDGWPKEAKDITILDPCMGSGHFLVFALPMLVAVRMKEESLSRADTIDVVLRENLFGLELDNRCTQIAAFNLALTAWRVAGYRQLPRLNLACSGLAPNTRKTDWLKIAGNNKTLESGMEGLHLLFEKAAILGSLINPQASQAGLLVAGFTELRPLLEKALMVEDKDDTTHEMAVTANGLTMAAEILDGQFTLVATNVPYLGRGKQNQALMDYCERVHPAAKADLATCFVERCLAFCSKGGTTALVTPQIWLFLEAYKALRANLLDGTSWLSVARLGSGSFETISGEVVNPALLVIDRIRPTSESFLSAFDVTDSTNAINKAASLRSTTPRLVKQSDQRRNPDARITLTDFVDTPLLGSFCISTEGLSTGDRDRFLRKFWEIKPISSQWEFFQGAPDTNETTDGYSEIVFWEKGKGVLAHCDGARVQGHAAWNRPGVIVGRMSRIRSTIYGQKLYDKSCVVLTPRSVDNLAAIYTFCCSTEFEREVRKLDKKIGAATSVPLKVPFDLTRWQRVAAGKYPRGLPKPSSKDPRQWLFNGHPKDCYEPLHVAVARLLGYQWPRQIGSSFPECPSIQDDDLEKAADAEGIVCLDALQGEARAADRVRALLAATYGSEWSPAKQSELLTQLGATSLEHWLREKFFQQHCDLFHNRPFVWHVWDGSTDGFHALVNYHKLAAPNGDGKRTLERLIYSYLGDWLKQQKDDQRNGVEGADAKVATAEHLKKQLEMILHGEPPYDIFVRWKPLHQQPIGWDPDINDGVRINIRPFMRAVPLNPRSKNACILRATPKIKWEKDRGKEPYREKEDFPWFWSWDQSDKPDFKGGEHFDGKRWNNLHYTNSYKQAAREKQSVLKKANKR